MKDKVIVQRDQQVTYQDLNNMGNFPQASFDLLIKEAIEPGLKYSGFTVIESGPAQVSVGAGIVLGDGKMYQRNDEGGVTIDLIENLPALANKIVAIVAWGQEIENKVEPRTFLLDPVTRSTEARAVATVATRYANVDKVVGTESTSPLVPLVGAGFVLVATVLLGPAGVISITQNEANQLLSTRELADALAELGLWRAQTGARLETIQTDVTALSDTLRGAARVETILEIARDVGELKSKIDLPEEYSSYGYDPFLVLEQSNSDVNAVTGNPTNVLFDAAVEEGIRFAPFAIHSAQINLLNSDDVKVQTQDKFIMPRFSEIERIRSVGRDDEISLSQYENQTIELVQKTVTRTRIRYGSYRRVCTNSAWWRSGKYDPATGIFRRGSETWDINDADKRIALINHKWVRVRQFWTDTQKVPYWAAQEVTESVNGSMIAQTFLNSQATWMTAIGLYFTRRGNANITLGICETTDDGAPDRSKMIGSTTLAPEDIKIYPEQTKVPFPITMLERGRRYAIVPISTGAHYMAVTVGNKFNQGTLFYSTDGSWFQGDLLKDLAFVIYAAKFETPRVEVQIEPWELAGGILDIDLLNDAIVPEGTALAFEVRVNNEWRTLSESDIGALGSLPPLLQARVVFQGTTDLMPRLGVQDRSRVQTMRPKQTFTHITDVLDPPVPVNTVWVDVRLEAFDPVHHTANVRLLSGAGYATVTNAATMEETPDPDGDPEVVTRRYIFTFGAPIDTFKIRTDGTTDSVQLTFHVAFRQHVALNV